MAIISLPHRRGGSLASSEDLPHVLVNAPADPASISALVLLAGMAASIFDMLSLVQPATALPGVASAACWAGGATLFVVSIMRGWVPSLAVAAIALLFSGLLRTLGAEMPGVMAALAAPTILGITGAFGSSEADDFMTAPADEPTDMSPVSPVQTSAPRRAA